MEVDQEERKRLQMVLDPGAKQKREEYDARNTELLKQSEASNIFAISREDQ